MKKLISTLLTLVLLCSVFANAQESPEMQPPMGKMQEGQSMQPDGAGAPPEKPEGEMTDEMSPEKPDGEAMGEMPPEKPEGEMNNEMPPDGPDGAMMGGMPGGGQGAPADYKAVNTVEEDALLTGTIISEGADENAILVKNGTASVSDAEISRISSESTGGDNSSFYGVGAALLAAGGTLEIENSSIYTDASGGAGVFAYGDGVVYVSDTTIQTVQDTSGGIHVAGGGTLYAKDLTVTTQGESSAAIRSDRGSGTMVVDGGSYTSGGVGSPAVYVTADISIHDAELTATGSEALCMEGLNTVRLYDCDLSGAMLDLQQNDHTWTVIVYQSMSGDSEVGKGHFEMSGGSLESENGGLFYTTNTESEFILKNVSITAAEDCEYFLRVSGNANARGWGVSGQNGANCKFTALQQKMEGNVIWDSISTLDMYVLEGSELIGAVVQDESYAGAGGDGSCALYIDESSSWLVTGDSVLSELHCTGSIVDVYGNAVSVVTADGEVLAAGESGYTVTVERYENSCDSSAAGEISQWEDYAVEF